MFQQVQVSEHICVICLTAKNMNIFKFSDGQYAKIVYNYNSTKEKLCKTKAAIWYYIKRARSSNLGICWNINDDFTKMF